MKKKILLFPFCLFLLCLFACSDLQMKPQAATNLYFDLPSFVKQQIEILKKQPCKVQKSLTSGNQTQEISAAMVDWQKELALFLEADINKPALRDAYFVNQDKSKIEYLAMDKKAKIRRILVKGSAENPTEIQVSMLDANLLYQTEKEFFMQFENNKLSNYEIKGFQKVLFKEQLDYKMQAKLVCP
jgi:hypothetical protein